MTIEIRTRLNRGSLSLSGAVSKLGFWLKVPSSLCELRPTGKAVARNKPEEYIRYFEDLTQAPNAEIGPKDNLETAPNGIPA